MQTSARVAILILAAGKGSRFGSPKQLADIGGKPMLIHVIQTARRPWADRLIVVLGAHARRIRRKLTDQEDVFLVENKSWKSGLASSIQAGIDVLSKQPPDVAGVIIILGDQPGVHAGDLDELYKKILKYPDHCIASDYDGTSGVPAFFPRAFWQHLRNLKGDQGARKILNQKELPVQIVKLSGPPKDIDTYQDLIDYQNE